MDELVEGIVLQSREYKESSRLVTLFTPQGVLSLIVKGLRKKPKDWLLLTEPFSHGEYHLVRRQSSLLSVKDATLRNAYLDWRSEYACLAAAGKLSQAILLSQLPEKASPQLYALYKAYHSKVGSFSKSYAFLISFYLKLLRLEGSLDFGMEPWRLSSVERELLEKTLACSQFGELERFCVEERLFEKVKSVFFELCRMN